MIAKNDNRTIRRQVMVTDSMDEKIVNEARRFGLSISSYLELVIGNHLTRRESKTMVDEKVI
jgi:post-segregation antitoxin (ccd killing protein)